MINVHALLDTKSTLAAFHYAEVKQRGIAYVKSSPSCSGLYGEHTSTNEVLHVMLHLLGAPYLSYLPEVQHFLC